ncbi:ATP11-domain-containing protein [Xylariaceae sp. FL0594]|nr:ATP11-domain-containing protein [Xylariaceae sp. FL0594]
MVAARLLSTTLGRRLQQRVTPLPSSPSIRAAAQITTQRRWAEVHDVRFLATTQAPRNIAEKYREKLDRKAREEGLRDVSELKAAYADKIREIRKKDSVSIPGLDALLADEEATTTQTSTQTTTTTQTQTQTQTQKPKSSSSTTTIKPLSEILDLPKARALPVKELTAIWRLHHSSQKGSLSAAIPTRTYLSLERAARQFPTFVLPVPRPGQGAEIHFLQWVFDSSSGTSTALFTQLAEYKARGEWAQPHTSVTHYPDFDPQGVSAETNQGVVLMAGNVVDGRGASVQDAQWLVMLLQRFYAEDALGTGGEGQGGEKSEKRKLLEAFAKGDGNFSVEKLLEESERFG